MAANGAEARTLEPDVLRCAALADERLRADPGDADALFVLAAARLASGQVSDAAAILSRLVVVRVDYPGLWQLKRTVHEALGERRAAEACVRAARVYGDA